jgi:hypothetical protein
VGDAINKLIDLDIVFARYTPFLTEDRYAYEGKAKYSERRKRINANVVIKCFNMSQLYKGVHGACAPPHPPTLRHSQPPADSCSCVKCSVMDPDPH